MSTPVAQLLDLDVSVADVDTLEPNPWNPNVMDERTYNAARESLRMYGFIDPVTVRPHPDLPGRWQIIDGEHRWKAAQEEGMAQVSIASLGPVSDERAKRLTIIFNETRGEADSVKMGRLLVELEAEVGADNLSIALPYTDAELRHYKALADVDWDTYRRESELPPEVDVPADGQVLALVYSEADYERVGLFLQMMGAEYELDDASLIVLRVLEDAARRRNA